MKKLLALLIIFLAILLIAGGWWSTQLSPVSSNEEERIVLIERGKSLSEIAKILNEKNLIKSELIFNLYTRSQGLGNKLSAGTFKLSPHMSTPEIIKALTGSPVEAWVTLVEGLRVEEMADKLNQELGIKNQEFLEVAKEGYMFPDTYLFPPDVTAEQVAKKMKDTFEVRFSDELREKIKSQGLTEEEGVILASIVEREGRSKKVREEVASILLKRLNINMGINADATLQYMLGYQEGEKSWWKRHLTNEDKKIDSPYNSYLYKGLPPTPICNPGLSSLEAVANADPTTEYLYYYHDSQGNSHYGKTLEEHNQNVANNP